jgi:hypothetical protein
MDKYNISISTMKTKIQVLKYILLTGFYLLVGGKSEGAENKSLANWQPDIYAVNKANTIWGSETNHVQVGLNVQYSSGPNGSASVGVVVALFYDSDTNRDFTPFITTNGTREKDHFSLMLPPKASRYKLVLFDRDGNIVPKTKVGESFDQPFDTNPKKLDKYRGYVNVVLFPLQVDVLPEDKLILQEVFNIPKPGKYHLQFVLNTLVATGDSGIGPFYLPVDVDIEISEPQKTSD